MQKQIVPVHALRFVLISCIIMSALLAGCASTSKVDLNLVQQYQSPMTVGGDETLIYVIRQNSMLGAARNVWVACNENIHASLSNGAHSYFKVKSGINGVNLVQAKIPFAYYRLDNRPGETVFLYFEMTKGTLTELDKDLGITLAMKSKRVPPVTENRENDGYAMGLCNPNLLGLYLMSNDNNPPKPDAENATITFFRAQSFAEELGVGLWSKEAFIGNLTGNTAITIKVPQGKHKYFVSSEHHAILEAEVDAGKQYFVQATVSTGWHKAHFRLLPIKADFNQGKLDKLVGKTNLVALDPTEIDGTVKQRLALALPIVSEALQRAQSGELESRSLEASDGR